MNLINKIIVKVANIRNNRITASEYLSVAKDILTYLHDRGVYVCILKVPSLQKISCKTSFSRKKWTFDLNHVKDDMDKLSRIYGTECSEKYIEEVNDGGVVVDLGNRRGLLDFQNDYVHIIAGRRVTVGVPSSSHNKIYTTGACTIRGTGVEDAHTVASYLQASINASYPECYEVVNLGIGRGSTIMDDFAILKEVIFEPGDIVILGSWAFNLIRDYSFIDNVENVIVVDSNAYINRHCNGREWYTDDPQHTVAYGNEMLSAAIYQSLIGCDFLSLNKRKFKVKILDNVENLKKGDRINIESPEFKVYIETLKKYRKDDADKKKVGSIVMNCNPFTLGHRFLIETAAKQVDYLYIFVVEENKSYFTFKDRIELVKKGTADLSNVIVLPSGNFIISAVTFPGYFYKDNLEDVIIDPSNDVNLFAESIAPVLNIKVRFAGEEPLDPITCQYNKTMKERLPFYGMQFVVIPRKEEGSQVISASRVRKCYEKGDFKSILNLVPPTTYDYLFKRYTKEKGL